MKSPLVRTAEAGTPTRTSSSVQPPLPGNEHNLKSQTLIFFLIDKSYGRKSAESTKPHFDVIFLYFLAPFLATYPFAKPKLATISENI